MILTFFVIMVVMLGGCAGKNEPKEWTYELLKEEFGGITEVSYGELKDCLKLLSKKEYNVCGYVREYEICEFMGYDISHIIIADGETQNEYEKELRVCCEKSDLENVSKGDYIFASGTFLAKVEYTKNDYSYQIDTGNNPVQKRKDENDYVTVLDFYNLMDKIHDDTFFKVKGLIIKDGDKYYLYESEESYKESKRNKIDIEFSEKQSNLNGKTVLIIGKPEVGSMYNGLKECSVVEEK